MIIGLLVVMALILLSALYVAAEFSAVAVRKTRIEELASEGRSLAMMLRPIVNDPSRLDAYIAACQIGITLTSLLLGAYGQRVFSPWLASLIGEGRGIEIAAALSTASVIVLLTLVGAQVVLGELLPKSLAMRYPAAVAQATVVPMRWSLGLFASFIWLLNGSANVILRLMRVPAGARRHVHAAEEIDLLVTESHEAGQLDDEERERLHNVFRLAARKVREVMVPRTKIFAVALDTPPDELMDIATNSPYTRIPVYDGSLDEVAGVVHVKDLLAASIRQQGEIRLSDLLREMPRVLETIPVKTLLSDMRAAHFHMSLVLDEYGGTAGLVTLEDLLEEVVGDIPDEYRKEPAPEMQALPNGRYRIPGRMLIEDINEQLDMKIEHPEVDTLGGFIVGELGRMPQPGDSVETPESRMTVESVENSTIVWVLFAPRSEEEDGEEQRDD